MIVMAKFTAKILRTSTHYAEIEVEADNEDDAHDKGEEVCTDLGGGDGPCDLDWDLDDEKYEVDEVSAGGIDT
ncbi:MAG: hypothetical protein ACXAEN_25225 [Candidatus Thorarchaeota archaeon]|jgi:hypothetical protein